MKAVDAIRQVKALNPKFVTIDIECGIEKDASFGHPNEFDLLCVGIGYAKGKVLVIGENALKKDEVLEELGDLLRSVRIVCQNGKFRSSRTLSTLRSIKIMGRHNVSALCAGRASWCS